MIKIQNLTLSLDDQVVLEDINFYFGRETYLLNGILHKRKSLLLNTLAQSYSGYNPHVKYVAEQGIAFLPNNPILIENLSVRQNIEFFTKFFGTTNLKARVISNHFELDNILNRKVNSLTQDHKQLVRIACILLNTKASVYLLDHLFDHLSKSQIDLVKDYLKQVADSATIIISKLNTHEIEEFNPRVINIVDKKLVFEEK